MTNTICDEGTTAEAIVPSRVIIRKVLNGFTVDYDYSANSKDIATNIDEACKLAKTFFTGKE